MRDDRAHVIQVKLCKANTRGVTYASQFDPTIDKERKLISN